MCMHARCQWPLPCWLVREFHKVFFVESSFLAKSLKVSSLESSLLYGIYILDKWKNTHIQPILLIPPYMNLASPMDSFTWRVNVKVAMPTISQKGSNCGIGRYNASTFQTQSSDVGTLNPLSFQHTIKYIIFIFTYTYNWLIGGNFCRVHVTYTCNPFFLALLYLLPLLVCLSQLKMPRTSTRVFSKQISVQIRRNFTSSSSTGTPDRYYV